MIGKDHLFSLTALTASAAEVRFCNFGDFSFIFVEPTEISTLEASQ
jgi:hypothetical protein